MEPEERCSKFVRPEETDGMKGANACRTRPRTTEDIDFLVGDEAFERDACGFVTIRVPVIGFNGVDVDQISLTDTLRMLVADLGRALVSEAVPIAPVETIVSMKLLGSVLKR